ncbi:hypothetical protein BaRGS_00038871 [Batillaria attramentaria]|uniref:Uncharacterized protein n=1 Tax=Batillaria attramentaria TaxID=370345 RepID=A0ABD0J5P9_9CAEN
MCEDPVPYRTQQAIKQRTPCAMCEDPVPYRARQATKQRTPCAMCEDPVPYRAQQATKQRTPCKMCGDPILWEGETLLSVNALFTVSSASTWQVGLRSSLQKNAPTS